MSVWVARANELWHAFLKFKVHPIYVSKNTPFLPLFYPSFASRCHKAKNLLQLRIERLQQSTRIIPWQKGRALKVFTSSFDGTCADLLRLKRVGSMQRDVAPFLVDVGQRPRWKATVFYYTLAALIAYWNFLKLLWSFLKGPFRFFSKQDRSHLDNVDPLPGVVHDYVDANGIRLHAVSLKRQPHKPLMLFLHGFPEYWYTWRHQLRAFAGDFDAVAIDMRGYGDSSKPQGVHNYDLDLLAEDISAVVRALGHRSCTLVAHDWVSGLTSSHQRLKLKLAYEWVKCVSWI
ncbi:Alpha/Beta hydrolase protein [Dunaliella salina]|uniref:Alpha/Beta hydrolase protein n=1 Tax=Dunaliella salina TaxID=3046 RepID=A0ABQ7GPP9_DUNSA|nr:Alpha/Beta hydrolase protein [Dunaliella salina]|eukprot:KAF5836584.1 Alpha/Beta hydrolase protein [Dunaliella salina]